MTKNYFYGIIKPSRKDFISNPTESDAVIMSEHFQYLKNLLDNKTLVLAGPSLIGDDAIGVYILETETIEEAKKLLDNDPSIQANIQILTDLRPIRLSLFRDIQ